MIQGQQNDGDGSWITLGLFAVGSYWMCFLFIKFMGVFPSYGLFLFSFLAIVIAILAYLGKRWLRKKLLSIFPGEGCSGGECSEEEHEELLPFFVKGQLRRRKLDLTRKSNFISDSIGTKSKRQREGIFGSKKKKRRRQ